MSSMHPKRSRSGGHVKKSMIQDLFIFNLSIAWLFGSCSDVRISKSHTDVKVEQLFILLLSEN